MSAGTAVALGSRGPRRAAKRPAGALRRRRAARDGKQRPEGTSTPCQPADPRIGLSIGFRGPFGQEQSYPLAGSLPIGLSTRSIDPTAFERPLPRSVHGFGSPGSGSPSRNSTGVLSAARRGRLGVILSQ